MNLLHHIVEPAGLLLTWQPQDVQASPHTRRVVGEIRLDEDGRAVFSYIKGTSDFRKACDAGFKGYPAFDLNANEITTGVIESLLQRLPPRKREDFSDFLALHRLPYPFHHSDVALLGYTGARLPSDGFALVPIFPEDTVPCDFLLEVAGFRHAQDANTANLNIGDPVTFTIDSDNPVDQDALSIKHKNVRIGYVNRALKGIFHHWLNSHTITACVERINGQPDRPLVYIRIAVR